MKKSMELLQKSLIPFLNGEIENYLEEPQNSEYESFVFRSKYYSFRSRLAKKTPTKNGYFVVFWEKDNQKKNQAFSFKESPDFLIVNISDHAYKGIFLFPKSVLLEQGILRTPKSKGRMAIRVYPIWEQHLNATAEQTQKWQLEYFIDLSTKDIDYKRLEALLMLSLE